MGSRENYFVSVGRQTNNNNRKFQSQQSKNENADHRVKETSTIRSIQVTYETDNISLLCVSTMSDGLIFCFLSILL